MTFIIYLNKKGAPLVFHTEVWDSIRIEELPVLGAIGNGAKMSFVIDEATYEWLEEAKENSSYEEETVVINMVELFKEKTNGKRF